MNGFSLSIVKIYETKSNASDNHSSSNAYPKEMEKYMHTKMSLGVSIGPFNNPPHTDYT